MNSLYLDTNFFVYLSDKISPFYKTVTKFLKNCRENNIPVVTSVETVQEVIHLAKNTKQLDKGLRIVTFDQDFARFKELKLLKPRT